MNSTFLVTFFTNYLRVSIIKLSTSLHPYVHESGAFRCLSKVSMCQETSCSQGWDDRVLPKFQVLRNVNKNYFHIVSFREETWQQLVKGICSLNCSLISRVHVAQNYNPISSQVVLDLDHVFKFNLIL